MLTAIISNSDQFIPLAYTLARQRLQVCIFLAPPEDPFIHRKAVAFCQTMNIPVKIEEKPGDVYEWMDDVRPNVLFVMGYRQLLDVNHKVMNNFPSFNIHPGPLPAFRGPVPVFWQLKNGTPFLGITIHHLSSRFDKGPIVWYREIPDQPHYNYGIIHQIFSQLAVEGVLFIFDMLARKLPLPVIERAGIRESYHKRPELKDVSVNWQEMTAVEICNLVRACNPWNKGALTTFNGQEIKLMDARVVKGNTESGPGTLLCLEEKICIACKDGKLISTDMFFFNDCFLPSYYLHSYGIKDGVQLR